MTTVAQVLEAYRELWKEENDVERRRLAETCLTQDVKYLAENVTCNDREEFLSYIGTKKSSVFQREYQEISDGHHDRVVLPWSTQEVDGSTTKGADFVSFPDRSSSARLQFFP
jgi:hypothetical protein